jgi:uncharacterized Tic20 family protein
VSSMPTPTGSVPPPINVATNDVDQRNMAALAHASILLNLFIPALGIIAAGAIWLTQRDRGGFAAKQALQATVYQLIWLVLPLVLAMLGVMVAVVIGLIGAAANNALAALFIMVLVLGLIVLLFIWLLGVIYALLAAYDTYHGRDFRYAGMGRILDR